MMCMSSDGLSYKVARYYFFDTTLIFAAHNRKPVCNQGEVLTYPAVRARKNAALTEHAGDQERMPTMVGEEAELQATLASAKNYILLREKGLDASLLPLGNPKGKDVLVFGCGKGNELLWCARHEARSALGIDLGTIYPHALVDLLEEKGLADFRWDMQQIDVQELALNRPGQFDLIVSNGVFEHVSDMRGVLLAFRHLLKPKGRVTIYADGLWYSATGGHLGTSNWEHLWMSEQAIKQAFPTRWHAYKHNLNRMTCIDFMSALRDSGALIKQFTFRSDPYIPQVPALLDKIRAKQDVSLTDLSITSIGCEFCFLDSL